MRVKATTETSVVAEKPERTLPYWWHGAQCWGHPLPWRDEQGTWVGTGWWSDAQRLLALHPWLDDALRMIRERTRNDYALRHWALIVSGVVEDQKTGRVIRHARNPDTIAADVRAIVDRRARDPWLLATDLPSAAALADLGLVGELPGRAVPQAQRSLEQIARDAHVRADARIAQSRGVA